MASLGSTPSFTHTLNILVSTFSSHSAPDHLVMAATLPRPPPLPHSTPRSPSFHGAPLRLPLAGLIHPIQQRLPLPHLPSLRRASPCKPSAIADPATLSLPEIYQEPLISSAAHKTEEKDLFDWNSQWYPVSPVGDLDKRVPTPVTIMGRDLVVWWDRHGQSWQVYEDKCPHRLAPLSEGRINEKGELQCSYHGWCFGPDSGSCTHIPQAPSDGPPVWKLKRACASVYPSVEQQGLIWFWPDTRPESRGIAARNPPPRVPVLDDATLSKEELETRNFPYGYDQLIENLMDPAHVLFAHRGMGIREIGRPYNYKVDKLEKSGYIGATGQGPAHFIAPCIFTMECRSDFRKNDASKTALKRFVLLFICVPVAPGQSKLIFAFPRNFSIWAHKLTPTWFIHLTSMLLFDSDLMILRGAERKLAEAGDIPWEKACYLATTSDTLVIGFRKWLRVYAGGGPNWGARDAQLPPPQPREQLMDRYWSHVKMCRHCTAAMQFFKGAGVFLQALSVAVAALLGAAALVPIPQLRSWGVPLVALAIVSSVGSRWLAHFVQKTYRFHDYNHGLVK